MSELPDYDFSNLLIEYKDNREYRKILRKLFKMDCSNIAENLENYVIDEESYDEFMFEPECITKTMDVIYEKTKNLILFQVLYDLAAAKMFSIDPSVGLCILFSYDYLYLFHACLCIFYFQNEDFNENCPYYIQLKEKLEKRR
jgi:hypothetical protein